MTKVEQAVIEIGQQTAQGFVFKFDGQAGSRYGTMDGGVRFSGNGNAVFKDKAETIDFSLSGGVLNVKLLKGNYNTLGFGQGVFIDGQYTKDKPVYTDLGIEDVLPSDELRNRVKSLLGDTAFSKLLMVVENNGGTAAHAYDGALDYATFDQAAWAGFHLIIKGDKIYCLSYGLGGGIYFTFYTNDPAWIKDLPSFMPTDVGQGHHALAESEPMRFVYKDI